MRVGDKVGAIIGAPPGTGGPCTRTSPSRRASCSRASTSTGRATKVVIESGIFPPVYYVLRGMLPPHVELHGRAKTTGSACRLKRIIEAD
ncbi:MAG: hypothetical protein M5U29_11455 [Anaerolineae bacterium]|nr:hypothetical protein [Anaerolineae bacterium]